MWINLGGGAAKLPVERRSLDIVGTMKRSGDWLVPRVEGKPFLSKPPLYHWLGAVVSTIKGKSDWWTVRAPSAFAGVIILWVTLAWGTALGGRALGGAAVILTGTMSLFLIIARRGAPDMVFSAACVVALFFFERMWRSRTRSLLPAFSLAVALALLAKGTAVLPVVGAPIALALTIRRSWRKVLRREVLLWLAAAAVMGASWYILILIRMPKEALHWALLEGLQPVAVEVVGHTGRHFRPLWYYLYRIWDIALPASVLLPLTVWHVWRAGRWRGTGEWPFLLWTFILVVLLFSFLPAKQPHYLLPLLPLLGLLMADALLSSLDAPGSTGGRILTGSLGVLLIFLALGAVLGLYYAVFVADTARTLAWAGTLAGGAALVPVTRWYLAGRISPVCLGSVAIIACLGLVYFGSFEEWKSLDRKTDRATMVQPPVKSSTPAPSGGTPKP